MSAQREPEDWHANDYEWAVATVVQRCLSAASLLSPEHGPEAAYRRVIVTGPDDDEDRECLCIRVHFGHPRRALRVIGVSIREVVDGGAEGPL